ncbi:hypothetical protein [Nocardia sp. NPDC049149]|uniref:hypothetical protein n=1 Tax=Nocardia sp. NPDC049149 TaxID=3364315 RepID=UPI0037228215
MQTLSKHIADQHISRGSIMKSLSESLMELATKVKKFEESSTAAREKNRAKLQSRREEFDSTFEHERAEFDKTTAELREAALSWWSDTKEAVERQISVMRADFEKWQADIKAAETAQPAAADKPAEALREG